MYRTDLDVCCSSHKAISNRTELLLSTKGILRRAERRIELYQIGRILLCNVNGRCMRDIHIIIRDICLNFFVFFLLVLSHLGISQIPGGIGAFALSVPKATRGQDPPTCDLSSPNASMVTGLQTRMTESKWEMPFLWCAQLCDYIFWKFLFYFNLQSLSVSAICFERVVLPKFCHIFSESCGCLWPKRIHESNVEHVYQLVSWEATCNLIVVDMGWHPAC